MRRRRRLKKREGEPEQRKSADQEAAGKALELRLVYREPSGARRRDDPRHDPDGRKRDQHLSHLLRNRPEGRAQR